MRRKHGCLIFLLVLLSAGLAFAQPEPGTVESRIQSKAFAAQMVSYAASAADSSLTSLQPVVSETGFINLSIDGLGIQDDTEGAVQVDKPAGATVRGAYLASADVWGTSGGPLPDGAVILNGQNVAWKNHVKGGANHAWADVTSIIAPVINSAPAGIVDITLKETMYLDGSILAVIFDDPNQHVSNTVILLFGAQQAAGDTFNVGLAEPIDKTDANLILKMSLGISYGYQNASYAGQYSVIDINGQRMTSCAGGQDDGYEANGGLITVGGVGDSDANPSDPYACPSGPGWDDELYSLLPHVKDGDTTIKVETENPSQDDSIYFAALFLGSTTAVVDEGIILAPASASSEINKQHSFAATVQDSNGNPVVNTDVTFRIISGPHASLTAVASTNSSGKAVYTYTGTAVGTDTIIASFIGSNGNTITSNEAVKEWVLPPNTPPVAECKDITVALDGNGNAAISASAVDGGSVDPDGDKISLNVSQTAFNCSNIGQNPVTLTVADDKGASATCEAVVTVQDKTAPAVLTKDITVQLDASGKASIDTSDIDNGTSDACGIASLAALPVDFTCSNIGTNTVTLAATDKSGNSSSATATVTVVDILAPTNVQANAPVTIAPQEAPISFKATATDNCSAAIQITDYSCYKVKKDGSQQSKMESCVVNVSGDTLTVADSGGVGDNIIWTIIATDPSGNATTAEGHVLVANPGSSGETANNGVGNGQDPQPPGNPPVNDGQDTSPGNPGRKGKK